MTFRAVDEAVCCTLSTGTHFLWHLLNATTLYLAMMALLPNLPAARRTG